MLNMAYERIVSSAIMKRILESNAKNHTKQRLCASKDAQIQLGKALTKNLSNEKSIPY